MENLTVTRNSRLTSTYIWILLIALTTEVRPKLTETPLNTAAVIGERLALNCVSDSSKSNTFEWSYKSPQGSSVKIGSCKDGMRSGFSFETPTPKSCNVVLENVTIEQAGEYECSTSDRHESSATAQLIVLDALPQCTTQPSDLVNLSDTVLMACSVSCYSYADTGPVMTWYDSTGLEVSANNTGTKLSPTFVIQETAAIPTVQSYTCRTNFTTVPWSTGSIKALNIPSYNSTCSTLPITVAYAPFKENITITSSTENELYTGSTLSCSASTVPEPYLYQWSNESGVIASSPVLTLDTVGDNLKYSCTVWNTQGDNELDIVINVLPDPALSTRTPTDPASMPCCMTDSTALIVGVVLGCLIVLSLSILIIVCCFVPSCLIYQRRYRQSKDEKPKEVNSSSTRNAEQPCGINAEFNQIDLSHTYCNLQIQNEILDTARNSSSSSQTDAFSTEEDEQVLNYAELQYNPTSANRRHTHSATSTPYNDEHFRQVGCDKSGDQVDCDKTEQTVYTAVVKAY